MKVLAESVSGHGPRPWFLNGCLCLFSAARTEYHGLDRIPFIKEKKCISHSSAGCKDQYEGARLW